MTQGEESPETAGFSAEGDQDSREKLAVRTEKQSETLMTPSILAGVVGGLALAASGVYLRYRRDVNAARARMDEVERHVVSTRWGGRVRRAGSGDPVLVVHGIFHNCVGPSMA